MFEGHINQQRAVETTTRRREREASWRGTARATQLRLARSRYESEALKDWRVRDKLRVLATKINRQRMEKRNYKFIAEGTLESSVVEKMAKEGCSALDAIKLLTEEMLVSGTK